MKPRLRSNCGGIDHYPVTLAMPNETLAELERRLAVHMENRPGFEDINARTIWAQEKYLLTSRIGSWRAA